MGLIYHAALENNLIMCLMDPILLSEMRHFRYFAG